MHFYRSHDDGGNILHLCLDRKRNHYLVNNLDALPIKGIGETDEDTFLIAMNLVITNLGLKEFYERN